MLVLLVLIFGAGTMLAIGFVGLLFTLLIAGLVGWAADLVVPGKLPYGWVGAVLAGLVGGFIGQTLFNALHIASPRLELFRVDLIPAFVGAVIIAVALQLFSMRRPVV